jgi:hypothetical protein
VSPNATHVDVVGKTLYLRQNYHFGPNKIAKYLRCYHDAGPNTPPNSAQPPRGLRRGERRDLPISLMAEYS